MRRASSSLAIGRVVNLDIETLRPLRESAAGEGFKFIERLVAEWASGANRFDGSGEAMFVAMLDSSAAGVCGLNRDPYSANARVGRVRHLYVLPALRRGGVASALLDSVIAAARPYFTCLRLRTDVAGPFFESRGFRPTPLEATATHVLKLAGSASSL